MITVLYNSIDLAPIIPNSNNVLHITDNKVYFDQNTVEGFEEDLVNSYFDTQSVDPTNGDESVIIGKYYKFDETHKLLSVTITGNNIEIANNAFKNCRNLQTITVNGTITSIGSNAFLNNESLDINILLPHTSVAEGTFCNCRSLQSIDLSNVTGSIGNDAFKFCASLRTINIPNGVTNIGENAFMFCGYNYSNLVNPGVTVNLPASVTSVGNNVFRGVPITSFTFPNNTGLTTLSKFMFAHTFLSEVELPSNITTIDTSAFESCYKLEKITIWNKNISIGYAVFANCPNFRTIIYKGTLAEWDSLVDLNSYWRNGSWETSPQLTVKCTDGNKVYDELTRPGVKRRSSVLHIDSHGYNTMFVNFRLFTIPSGLSLYKVTGVSNGLVTLGSKITGSTIASNTPYLAVGTAGYYPLSGKYDPNAEENNSPLTAVKLTGVHEDTQCPSGSYILDCRAGIVGFYPGNGEIVPANLAYLTP